MAVEEDLKKKAFYVEDDMCGSYEGRALKILLSDAQEIALVAVRKAKEDNVHYIMLTDWLKDKNREQSNLAFTAGANRDLAYYIEGEIEQARKEERERKVELRVDESAQPELRKWFKKELEQVRVEEREKTARDVFAFIRKDLFFVWTKVELKEGYFQELEQRFLLGAKEK